MREEGGNSSLVTSKRAHLSRKKARPLAMFTRRAPRLERRGSRRFRLFNEKTKKLSPSSERGIRRKRTRYTALRGIACKKREMVNLSISRLSSGTKDLPKIRKTWEGSPAPSEKRCLAAA